MPFRINSQTIVGIASEKMGNKPDFCRDVQTISMIMQDVAYINPSDCDAETFKRKLQEIILAATSAASRILDKESVSSLHVSSISALDRFAIIHFASVQRALLQGVGSIVTKLNYEVLKAGVEISSRSQSSRSIRDDIKRTIDLAIALDIPYTLSVNPISELSSYYKEHIHAFSKLIGLLRDGWNGGDIFIKAVETSVHEYGSWVSIHSDAATIIKSYLNYMQQHNTNNVIDNVSGLSLALKDFLHKSINMSDRRKESWQAYRDILCKLPDDKITMFAESFGVRKVFVQPSATYKVAGVKRLSDAPVADVAGLIGTLISDRISGDDLILLAGGPGSGKSTLCRILAAELAVNEEVHPVFLRLRRLQDSQDVRGFIENHLQGLGLIDRIADLASVPNLVLILDGFDELVMASRTKLREFFNALKEDLSTGPLRQAKAIVSGRDTLFPNGQGLPTGAHVISLQPFDRSRIEAWGAKWRTQHLRDAAKGFYPERLVSEGKGHSKKASPLEHLVSWPLTLHLVARAHASGSIELKPNNANEIEKAVLYRSIVADTALRQDDQAGGRGRLNPQQMRRFVQAIAWEMYSTGREALDVSEGLPILRSILPEASESDLSELADVTIVNQPELTKGEETGFEFVHKSFSEYFAAETIAIKIEETCFKVPQWGGAEKSWRMSTTDATSALASLFAVRLLTAEVQEMLEPMLDDFLSFLSGPSTRLSSVRLDANLERKLLRFENLIHDFGGGALLREVSEFVKSNKTSVVDLEAFANYASGLLFIAVSLAHRRKSYVQNLDRRVKIASNILIRLIHVVLAGDVQIDWSYAQRGLRLIDARKQDGGNVEVIFPPLAPRFLQDVVGLDSHLDSAISILNVQKSILEIENIILSFANATISRPYRNSMHHRQMSWEYRYHRDGGYLDYLHRIMPAYSRTRYSDPRYIEERMFGILERLRVNFPDDLPISFVEEMIARIRELAQKGQFRMRGDFEFYEEAEATLLRMIDMEMHPGKKLKISSRKKKT